MAVLLLFNLLVPVLLEFQLDGRCILLSMEYILVCSRIPTWECVRLLNKLLVILDGTTLWTYHS
jgi:hypothetical protein